MGNNRRIFHLEEGRNYVSFEYDKDFIRMGVEISPIKMPLSNRIYEFPELATLHLKVYGFVGRFVTG
jgi:serine/threonine-protein kinase HipA